MSRSGRRSIRWREGEPAYRFLALVIAAVNRSLTRHDWRHQERVPASGGVLVVANHISNYDPLALGEYLLWAGRWPRFLGKSDLWQAPVVGFFARGCRQIPVERNTTRAVDALHAAKEALDAGELVALYPEGTITADPQEWPMTGHTGAARIALETRCPVLPVGQWGANHIIPGKKLHLPRYWPRKTLQVQAGELLDLSDLYDHPDQRVASRVATERMMQAITDLTAELRGQAAPEDRYDIRKRTRVPRGAVTLPEPPAALG